MDINSSSNIHNIDSIQNLIYSTIKKGGFDSKNLHGAKVLKVDNGYLEVVFTIRPDNVNYGGLYTHGGFLTYIIDLVTGLSYMTSKPVYDHSLGFTININTNIISATKVGDQIKICSKILKKTNYIAFAYTQILNSIDDSIIANSNITLKIPKPNL